MLHDSRKLSASWFGCPRRGLAMCGFNADRKPLDPLRKKIQKLVLLTSSVLRRSSYIHRALSLLTSSVFFVSRLRVQTMTQL